jgi:phage terminase large subunit-like protein
MRARESGRFHAHSKYWMRSKRIIAFIEQLIVPSGEGQGKPFKLLKFQKDFIRAVYDPSQSNGRRKIRRAILSMGRKNGKTALIACLVLAHLVGPLGITNGEIISAANSQAQAAQVFKYVRQIIEADPELQAMFEMTASTYAIRCRLNGSIYRAIGADAHNAHGLNPTVAIYDELAQSKSNDFFDALDTSMGARQEPLLIVISTQNNDPTHILSKLIDDGLSTPGGSTHVSLYAADEDCDLADQSQWEKANPALDKFLSRKEIADSVERAIRVASFEPTLRNLYLNQRVSPYSPFIAPAKWREAGDPSCALIPGESIYLAADLSAKLDLTALTAVSANPENTRCAAWFWKPNATLVEHTKRDHREYDQWHKQGLLYTSPGETVDAADVATKVIELTKTYTVLALAYDAWRIDTLLKEFDRQGFLAQQGPGPGLRLEPFVQGVKSMAPAMDALESEIASGRFKHPNHPILTWNFMNAIAVSDPAGNRKLDKSKARLRIDGAVAMVMSFGMKAQEREILEASNPWEKDPEFSVWV